MSGFTKLVPEIIQSSIWNESPEIRCVWITLLALKDADGIVVGNAVSLSRLANISLPVVQDALHRFQQPDPDSRTPDHEGRRIEPVPGGFRVLNHTKYREVGAKDYWRQKKQQQRSTKTSSDVVDVVNVSDMSKTCPRHTASASVSVSDVVKGVQGEKKRPRYEVTEETLVSLTGNAAYEGIDVRREFAKCTAWCDANGKEPTLRRFTNWLNRCDPTVPRNRSKRPAVTREIEEVIEVPVL